MEQNGWNEELEQLNNFESLQSMPLSEIMSHPVAKAIYDIGFKMGQDVKELQDMVKADDKKEDAVDKDEPMEKKLKRDDKGMMDAGTDMSDDPVGMEVELVNVKVEPVDSTEADEEKAGDDGEKDLEEVVVAKSDGEPVAEPVIKVELAVEEVSTEEPVMVEEAPTSDN